MNNKVGKLFFLPLSAEEFVLFSPLMAGGGEGEGNVILI